MTIVRLFLLVLFIGGILSAFSFVSGALAMPCSAVAGSADLIKGQAGKGIAGNTQTSQGLTSLHQQPALMTSGSVANYAIFRISRYDTGTSIFQNLTGWKTPAMTPYSPPTGNGFVTTGTVIWIPVEGGFFGIISDDGKRYDPLNLPAEYAVDGMRVGFTAKTDPDMASFHMWGTIVSIIDIYPISKDVSYRQGIFVHYERTGGIAGLDDQLTIYENRTAEVVTRTGGKTFTITPTEMADLVSVFESSGFDSINQEDLPMYKIAAGADLFNYVIEYRGHKIQAVEPAIPKSLQPVIDALDAMVRDEE